MAAAASTQCVICLDAKVGAWLAPCGHMCMCWPCAVARIGACPSCGAGVAETVPLVGCFATALSAELHAKLWSILVTSTLSRTLLAVLTAPLAVGGFALGRPLALQHVCAFYEFMACKAAAGDFFATLLSPSDSIDKVWHVALLHPQQYLDALAPLTDGRVIGHCMRLEDDAAAHAERRTRAEEMHNQLFKAPDRYASVKSRKAECAAAIDAIAAPAATSGSIRVAVCYTDRDTCMGAFVCAAGATVNDLMCQVEAQHGIAVPQQRLIFNGRQLVNDRELARDCSVQDGDILYLVLRVRGC